MPTDHSLPARTRPTDTVHRRARDPACAGALLAIALAAGPAGVGPTWAQDSGAAAVRLGETRLVPAVRLGYEAHDNVFQTNDDVEKVDATALQVRPSLDWTADRRLLELSVSYDGLLSDGSENVLDFDEHAFEATVAASPSSKWRLAANLSLLSNSEQRDVIESDSLVTRSVRSDSRRYGLGASATYGGRSSKGNVTGGLRLVDYDPEQIEERTVEQRDASTQVEPFGRLSLRLSPATRLVFEARFADLDYAAGSVDQRRTAVLAGIDRAETGISGGSLRLGYVSVDYDRPGTDPSRTLKALVNFYYLSSSFSRFDLDLSRDFDERVSFGDADNEEVVLSRARLGWSYDWSSRVSHELEAGLELVDRECPSVSDSEYFAGGELTIQVRRWLGIGVDVGYRGRGGDVCSDAAALEEGALDFDALRYGAFLEATL